MYVTNTEENYIKCIYSIAQNETSVNTNTIAAAIATKASSVTDMLKKLKLKKIISYKPYEGCKLTPEGEKMALQIIRKHRLWETFLCQTLGYSWDEVHEIAEELEHIGNVTLINKLDAHLGFPKTDPHGDLIPDANGKLPKHNLLPLVDKKVNTSTKVQAVNSHEKGILELLNYYGIHLQSSIEITQKFEFDDSVEVLINDKQKVVLPYKHAQSILVN